MRTVPVGDGTSRVVEIYATTHCSGSRGALAYPHVLVGYLPCPCAGGNGHRTLYCKDCRITHYEPEHTPQRGVGAGDYFTGSA